MATLNEVMKDTADAIREKTGKSELIAPVDFASEIKGISAGGGESGGSNWRYYDFSNYRGTIYNFLEAMTTIFHTMRFHRDHLNGVYPLASAFAFEITDELLFQIKAVGVDMSAKVKNHPISPSATTVAELFATDLGGVTLENALIIGSGLIEITEDEFLNKTFE